MYVYVSEKKNCCSYSDLDCGIGALSEQLSKIRMGDLDINCRDCNHNSALLSSRAKEMTIILSPRKPDLKIFPLNHYQTQTQHQEY